MRFDGRPQSVASFAFWPDTQLAVRRAGLSCPEYNPDRAVLTVPGLERVERGLELLAATLAALDERQAKIEAVLSEVRNLAIDQRTIKESYSPAEVAEVLGKKPYTVREWCRLHRINATKRPYGRGDADEWEISHDELDRIKNHGLLPVPTKY